MQDNVEIAQCHTLIKLKVFIINLLIFKIETLVSNIN